MCWAGRWRIPEVGIISFLPAEYASAGTHMGVQSFTSSRDATTRLSIGSFSSIAHGVEISLGGNHRTDWISTFPFRFLSGLPGSLDDGPSPVKGNIMIGSDVWIGKGAKVLSGVQVGNGAVIGAYAVVSEDVRPYAVVVGSPAWEVKRRFSDDAVEALQELAWWDWPIEDIMEAVPLLCGPDVDALLGWSRNGSGRP